MMASKNLEIYRAAHHAFNRRDFDAVVSQMADDVVFQDYARGITFKGRKEFKDFLQGWVTTSSDARVSEPKYIDGGDTIIAEFSGRGNNDGPLGSLPKTGKAFDLRFCEIMRFDSNNRIVSGGIYYDQLTMLTQLGHIKPEGAAAV